VSRSAAGGAGHALPAVELAMTVRGVRAPGEDAEVRLTVLPTKVEEDGCCVVRICQLFETTVGVDAVDEHVAAIGQPVEREVLSLEEGGVVVSVADGDALVHAEPSGLREPTTADEHRFCGRCLQRAVLDWIAVTEAKAGLLVLHERGGAFARRP
jgi:hypothetical protein